MTDKSSTKLFEKAAFGYRTEEVERYIEQQTAQIHALEEEKADLLGKMKILAEKINDYRKDEGNLRDALLGAQKMGNTIVSEAKTKADMMLTDAKSRSERMIYEAQKSAEETISSIRAQSDREKMTLAKMEKMVADFKAKLLSIYKVHLNAITSLPDMEEEYESIYNAHANAAIAPQPESPEPSAAPEPPAPPQPAESAAEWTSDVSTATQEVAAENTTMRFDRVERNAPAAPAAAEEASLNIFGRKPSFEEKFGDLKFGKNNPAH